MSIFFLAETVKAIYTETSFELRYSELFVDNLLSRSLCINIRVCSPKAEGFLIIDNSNVIN